MGSIRVEQSPRYLPVFCSVSRTRQAQEPLVPSATVSLQRAQEQEQEQELENVAAASPSPLVLDRSRNVDLCQFVRREVHSAINVALSEAITPMLATNTAPGSGTPPPTESPNAGNLAVPQT